MTDPVDLARFKACLPFTLAQECPLPNDWSNPNNFSDDAHDPGGKTMCGITQREYDTWRKVQGLPAQDVRLLTSDEGGEIYDGSYFLPDCPKLAAGLDLVVFDANVNEGCTEATRMLQYVLNIVVDGAWGAQTTAAVAAIKDVRSTIAAFTARREAVYRTFAGYRYFGADWERRSREIGAAALKMAA